jgi:hypothetical protein
MSKATAEAALYAKELAIAGIGPYDRGPLDDFFNATAGRDYFSGGSGSDTVSYNNATSGVSVSLQGAVTNPGLYAQFDTLVSIENLVGSKYNDTLFGSQGANVILGRGGNDTIYGNGGNDRLYGGSGNDTIHASAIRGESVVIDGGSGADNLNFYTVGGNAEITTGSGIDKTTIAIGNSEHFHIVMTDFQPYWETFGSNVTDAEALRGDQLTLLFSSNLGNNPDVLGQFTQEINGDDLTLHFTNANVHGEIVFEDIGQWLDLTTNSGFTFNIGTGMIPNYEAV